MKGVSKTWVSHETIWKIPTRKEQNVTPGIGQQRGETQNLQYNKLARFLNEQKTKEISKKNFDF